MQRGDASLVAAVLIADGVCAGDLDACRALLSEQGVAVRLIAPTSEVRPLSERGWSAHIVVDGIVSEVFGGDFDILFIPAGVLGVYNLRASAEALSFIREFYEDRKALFAVGQAPQLLIDLDIGDQLRVSGDPVIQGDLHNAGYVWEGWGTWSESGSIITAPDVEALRPLLELILSSLRERIESGRHPTVEGSAASTSA